VRCAPVVRAHAARVRPLRSRGDRTGPLRFEQTATLEPMSTEHRAPTYLLAGGGPPGTSTRSSPSLTDCGPARTRHPSSSSARGRGSNRVLCPSAATSC
jgi:hypothetical protein